MKKTLIALALSFFGVTIASAVSLKIQSGANDTIAFANGTSGAMTFVVGYYSAVPNFSLTSPADAFTAFTPVVTLNYDGDTAGIPGFLGTSTTTELVVDPFVGAPGGGPVVGKIIYTWVFDTGFSGTFASATQYGLFNQNASTFGQTDGALPANSAMSFTDATASYTQVQYGSVVDAQPGTAGAAQFRLVPEPSTAALGLLAGLGLLTRRRRA